MAESARTFQPFLYRNDGLGFAVQFPYPIVHFKQRPEKGDLSNNHDAGDVDFGIVGEVCAEVLRGCEGNSRKIPSTMVYL